MPDRGIVPMAQMAAAIHAGGMVAGAFEQEGLAGFVYGFPAIHGGDAEAPGLHSHMLAVLPDFRGRGIGKALKWYQRAWCLEQGLSWMTWTFDPLQRRNAHLNFQYLGATVSEYLVNAYGNLEDDLNIGLPTDRLVALWELAEERVVSCADGKPLNSPKIDLISKALSKSPEGYPEATNLGLSDTQVSIATPENINELMRTEPELAAKWRLAVRDVLLNYLESGYKVIHFYEGSFILEKRMLHT